MSSFQPLGVTSERKWKDNSDGIFCFIPIVASIVLYLTMPASYMRVRVDICICMHVVPALESMMKPES